MSSLFDVWFDLMFGVKVKQNYTNFKKVDSSWNVRSQFCCFQVHTHPTEGAI